MATRYFPALQKIDLTMAAPIVRCEAKHCTAESMGAYAGQSAYEALRQFHAEGWRRCGTQVLCPSCVAAALAGGQ